MVRCREREGKMGKKKERKKEGRKERKKERKTIINEY
jgi:hypothetical protein